MKNAIRSIRIRPTGKAGLMSNGEPSTGMLMHVTHESEAALQLDNGARGDWHVNVTMAKLPNGHLANSAGQEWEVLPQ